MSHNMNLFGLGRDRMRKTVLVTGCSSGIGLELAKILSQSPNYKSVVTARAKSIHILREALPESENFLIREMDVTLPDQVRKVVEEMSHTFGQIDIVINNAGVCYRGVVEHMDEPSEMDQIRTNYLGPMGLVRRVLPIMREQKSGCIINVSSVSGFLPMPTMGSYSASKHALEAASEALWYEAHPYGIRVHTVRPGFVRSDSYMNVRLSNKAKISEALFGPHSEFYFGMTPFIAKMMHFAMAGSDKVARRILAVAESKHAPRCVAVTVDAVILTIVRKLLPLSLFNRLMYFFLPGSKGWGKGNRRNPQVVAAAAAAKASENKKILPPAAV